MNLAAPGGPDNDLLVDLGDLTLDGFLQITPGAGFGPGEYTLITYDGTLTDDGLEFISPPGFIAALDLSIPGQVNLDVTAVPEPASLALLLPAAFLFLRRSKRWSA